MSIPITRLERRVSLLAISVSIGLFVVLLAVSRPLFPSFDEAKYLGIGYRFLAGEGPRTLFGALFTPHSPLWAIVVVAPDVLLGIDPLAVGRLLNALSGVGLLALVAAIGWPVRPAVATLAVVMLVSFWYLHDLTRTARLDVPAAALALLYVWLGVRAVRDGRVATGLAAGVVFATAFLVKEIALPLAPVPFLIGVLERRPWASLARTLALVVLVGVVGTSWWFVTIAEATGRVYRLGTPAWTLVPLLVLAGVVVVIGLSWGRLARTIDRRRVGGAVPEPALQARAGGERSAAILAWGGAVAWFIVLAFFFQSQDELKGNGLIQPRQYLLYLQTWLPSGILQAGVVAFGAVLGLWSLVRGDQRTRSALAVPATGLVCSAPLVLLVIAVGEPPRNYLAQIGLVAVLAAAGWWTGLAWLWPRLRTRSAPLVGALVGGMIGVVAGLSLGALAGEARVPAAVAGLLMGAAIGGLAGGLLRRAGPSLDWRRVGRIGLVVLLGAAFSMSALALGVHAYRSRESPGAQATATAIETAAAWIRTNVAPGTALGFGSFSSYHLALELRDRYPMFQIDQVLAVYDPAAPFALRGPAGSLDDDWIAIDRSRRALEFYAFHGRDFAEVIRRAAIGYYVYVSSGYTSVPALTGALTPDHGFDPVAAWTWPTSDDPDATRVAVNVYRVDPARVDFTGSRLFVPPEALAMLVDLLEAESQPGAGAARNLAERVSPLPPSAAGLEQIERLRRLAGR